MKLVQTQCKKEGFEKYTDFYLITEKEGKEYKVRVRPVFWRETGLLKEIAEPIE